MDLMSELHHSFVQSSPNLQPSLVQSPKQGSRMGRAFQRVRGGSSEPASSPQEPPTRSNTQPILGRTSMVKVVGARPVGSLDLPGASLCASLHLPAESFPRCGPLSDADSFTEAKAAESCRSGKPAAARTNHATQPMFRI